MFSETLLSIQRILGHNGSSMSCPNQVCGAFFEEGGGGGQGRRRERGCCKRKQANETQCDF